MLVLPQKELGAHTCRPSSNLRKRATRKREGTEVWKGKTVSKRYFDNGAKQIGEKSDLTKMQTD